MTNTQALLTRARDKCDPPTWYQLGQRTGIAHTTISRCMRHEGTLDNKGAFQLAEFLGIPHKELLALIELDRAKTDESRSFWERYAPRILPAVVAAVAVGALTPDRALASVVSEVHKQHVIHYAHQLGSGVASLRPVCPIRRRQSLSFPIR